MATRKKASKDPLPMGRPSKYQPSMGETVVACMKKGYIVDEVCAELGIHRDTFFEWVKEYPDFSDSYKKGRTFFNAFAARMYRNAMLGVPITREDEEKKEKQIIKKNGKKSGAETKIIETRTKEFRANPAMMIFYMKAHCGWSETVINKVDANVSFDPAVDQKILEIFYQDETTSGRKPAEKNKGRAAPPRAAPRL